MAQPEDRTERHPGGRPSDFTPELADAICERLAKGEPLARICEDAGMPSYTTVWRWERANDEFRKASARARELGTHWLADECLKIADGQGEAQDKRLRIDTRLRLIGKWNAKAYGDKVAHVGGGPEDEPIRHRFDLATLTDEELEQLERIRGKLGAPEPGGYPRGEGEAGG